MGGKIYVRSIDPCLGTVSDIYFHFQTGNNRDRSEVRDVTKSRSSTIC